MENLLYKINDYAHLLGITVDTLLFYEKKGIFMPYEKDNQSGYRYYSTCQIFEISEIIQLKELGFSLEEIKAFKTETPQLEKKIGTLKEKIGSLNEILKIYTILKNHTDFSAYTKIVPAHFAVSKKCIVSKSEHIKQKFDNLIGDTVKNKLRIKHPLNFYCEFFDDTLKFEDNSIEIFVEVENSKSLEVRQIPEKKYVCTVLRGDYENLVKAYDFLFEYSKTKNLALCGNPVEHYLEAYGTQTLSANYITEICLPIVP